MPRNQYMVSFADEACQEAVEWAETLVAELKERRDDVYPWRSEEAAD